MSEKLKKTKTLNFYIVLISTLFSLILVEILMKNFYRNMSNPYWKQKYNLYQQGEIYTHVGDVLKYYPNKSILTETYYYVDNKFHKEFSYKINTNNYGLVQEHNIKKNIPSILFLGDSFTEGIGAKSWINNFNGSFKNYQIINGGILGYGPVQFEKMDYHISKNYNVNKVVVLYIAADIRRSLFKMPNRTILCLKNYKNCKGDENFYGFPMDKKPVMPFLNYLKDYRENKINLEKNTLSFKKIRRSIRFFIQDLYIIKLPSDILRKKYYRSKNKEIMKNFDSFTNLHKKYGDAIIFIRIQEKKEMMNNRFKYESVYATKHIKELTNKHFICDFDNELKSFYEYDPHPNKYGYNKLFECVEKIISKNFIF